MIFLTLLVINLLLILILHNLAFKLNLIDFPNSRKIHQGEIPLVVELQFMQQLLLVYY